MGHFANNIQSICTAGKMLLILSLLLTLLSSGISRPSLKGTPIDEIINGLPKVAETLTDEFNWHKEVIDKEITSENDEKMQGPEVSEPVETISEAGEAEKQEIIVETNMESFELNIPPAEMPAESYQEVQPENEHLDAERETEVEPAAETSASESETEPYEPAAEEAETSESEVEPEVEPVAETLDNESETEPYEPVEEEAEISESEVEPEDEPAAETSESEVEPEDEPASETSASESETEPYKPAAEEAETSEGNNVTVMEESEPKEDVVPEDEPDQPDDMEPKAESDASNM